MLRAWIFSSTRWWSLSMYMTPTVTFWSNGSPVRPSKSTIWPERGSVRLVEQRVDLVLPRAVEHRRGHVDAPPEPLAEGDDLLVGEPVDELAEGLCRRRSSSAPSSAARRVHFSSMNFWSRSPTPLAAQPRCVSRICPMFMRLGTPSGLRTMSTGRPSSRYGMSSSGRTRLTTPLLPWRPAILSPTASLRLMATYTLTILMTPGGSSSPFLMRAIFSPKTSFTASFVLLEAAEDVADLAVQRLAHADLGPVLVGHRWRAARRRGRRPS